MGVSAPYGQVEIPLPPIGVISSRKNDGSAILRYEEAAREHPAP